MLFGMPMGGPTRAALSGGLRAATQRVHRAHLRRLCSILSVQHPSQNAPFTGDPNPVLQRSIEVLSSWGLETFLQTRTVPKGSNWPSNVEGDPDGCPLRDHRHPPSPGK